MTGADHLAHGDIQNLHSNLPVSWPEVLVGMEDGDAADTWLAPGVVAAVASFAAAVVVTPADPTKPLHPSGIASTWERICFVAALAPIAKPFVSSNPPL